MWENMDEGTLTKTKEMLDDMHKRKIDMADEIFVINVGGYIGESTRSEIEYAKAHGKKIRYTPVDRPTLDQLGGVMNKVGAEYGLLVSWSGFKSSVEQERGNQFFKIRLAYSI